MSDQPDQVEQSKNLISINVTSQNYEDIMFKLKKNTPFKKIITKYCERYEITDRKSIKFIFDGDAIREDQTPEEIDMDDGDVIEAITEQVGGN
jgi:small ubiquitin-related modifier